MAMGRVLAALAAIVALWAGWWWIAASQEAAATRGWFEERRAAGWLAELDDVAVTGFPLSYRTRISAPALADPGSGWAWEADWLDRSRPRHPQLTPGGITVIWPEAQTLRTPTTRIALTSDVLEATVHLQGAESRIARADLTLQGLVAETDADGRVTLDAGTLTAVADPERPEVVALTVNAEGWTPPAPLLAALSDVDIAPDTIGRLRIEATAAFDIPWTTAALEQRRPQPEWIDISNAGLSWGALDLRIAGQVQVGEDGEVEGELLLKATNWRDMLAAGQASGALSEGVARAMERALELASRLAGSSQTLDIPLSFDGGRTRLGPVPLGPAPRLVLP